MVKTVGLWNSIIPYIYTILDNDFIWFLISGQIGRCFRFLDPQKSNRWMVVAKTLHKDELQGSSEPVPPSKPSWCGHGEVRISSTETELRIGIRQIIWSSCRDLYVCVCIYIYIFYVYDGLSNTTRSTLIINHSKLMLTIFGKWSCVYIYIYTLW